MGRSLVIFKSIAIYNLFSYCGETIFDLAPAVPDERRNIVVIMGRNGYGKTSFLNSVKLLFGGVTKDLTAGVQRGSVSTQKSYVLGHQDWWGILNHKAHLQGETRCWVKAVLLDEAGQETVISRRWDLSAGDYKDTLQVTAPRKRPMEAEEAQRYLSRILPLDYIPFFFFDAEEVGYLAEANSNQTIEKMEQLLNIRPADNLREGLKDIRRDWRRDTLDSDTRDELLKKEHRVEELQRRIDNLEWEFGQVSGEIEELKEERRVLQQKIRISRGTGNIENASRLDAEKKKEEERLAESLYNLSASFERDGFLRVNANLAQKALKAAELCASSQSNAASELLESLKDPLKEIFVTPPYPPNRLGEDQIRFYQQRILKLLDSRNIAIDNDSLFAIETGRAKKLSQLLAAYQPEREPGADLSEDLKRALNAEKASIAAEMDLQNANHISEDAKLRLEQLEHDAQSIDDDLLNKRDRHRKIESELAVCRRDIGPLKQEAEALHGKVKQSDASKTRLALLDNMQSLLEAYKNKLKQQMRETLEQAFDRHLRELLDSNALIHAVQIDEYFQIGYRDGSGVEVPMGSLSAGMKQLAATALLWALKDASERFLPVIIDTPLGRIDRAHQDNLLTRYYPRAGTQVILLPTDSELDDRKRALLAPHIYLEYRLDNPSGEATQVRRIESCQESMYG